MKIKLNEINKKLNGMRMLLTATFPARLSYALAYNIEKFQKETERIEEERIRLCRQYADKDEAGEPIMLDSVLNGAEVKQFSMTGGNRENFEKEYEELMNSEVEIEIRTVKPEVIERCEDAERYTVPSVEQMMIMSFMLEE
jgi:hypothetical protein